MGVRDGNLTHGGHKVVPRQGQLTLAKEGILPELVVGSGSVGKQESHTQVIGRQPVSGAGGEEFKGHGRGVVAYAVEGGARGRELGEAEKRHEGAIGAELHV